MVNKLVSFIAFFHRFEVVRVLQLDALTCCSASQDWTDRLA
jgi:hypothetical protein